MMFKHLPFQCACNDNEILASYAKGYYNFYEVEKVEKFVIFKGAYEIASLVTSIDDAPYKSENLAILQHCYDNYKDNCYIAELFLFQVLEKHYFYCFVVVEVFVSCN